MLPANRYAWFVIGVLASLVVAGCATDGMTTASVTKQYRRSKPVKAVARKEEPAKIDTGSIATPASPANPVTSREDPRWQWCEQRHVDHQAGRAPGGATDLNKKLEDDRVCAAVYERG